MIRETATKSSGRRWLIVGGLVLLLLFSLGSLVRFYTDLLWFQEVGFSDVFLTILWSRFGVGLAAGVVAALFVLANLEVARRAAPTYRFVSRGTDMAEQYRAMIRPYAGWVNIGVAGVVGLLTGLSTSTAWDTFLLWQNSRPFGMRAPEPFGRDVSFYVFSIPFQRTLLSLLFGVVISSLFLGALAHLVHGSIEPESGRVRVASVVKVHLSVLLGILALLKAWSYRLDQFELVFSPRGTVTGASFTDVNAQLPALRLLMVIAIVAAAIFFVNIRFRGWLLPGAAIALWGFSSLLLGAVIPAAVQRFQVVPNEPEREAPFIERNIEATRRGYGLDRVDVREFPASEQLSEATLEENRGTIQNVRVWSPDVLKPTYQRLQAIRPYYQFSDVDVDRYTIDGRMQQMMISAREVAPDQLTGTAINWVNTRLTYTHGYGAVASPANAVTPEGFPQLTAKSLPPEGPEELVADQGGIYYGENLFDYAVVRTDQPEIDYPTGERDVQTTTYDGEGGVELASLLRRVAFAWRFGDANLLISGFINPESKVLMRRDIRERATAAAPFLRFDNDPYFVISGGRQYWILDAYTTTDRFPYSERMELGELFGGRHRGTINYIRNSVKVIVDAYDGTMTFYVVDPSDAIAGTYQRIFPGLLRSGDEIPDELRSHLRYPEDLFLIQASQYRLYHMDSPRRLYEREDLWDIPSNPVLSQENQSIRMDPYYVVMKLPGEEQEEFLLMLPFTPHDRPILNGWMAARSDPEHYGELVAFSFPRGISIDGPENISARINQDPAISQQFTLWQGAGSQVEEGNLLVMPIGESLIYVQPVYLRASRSETALPELRRVIVVLGDRIGFEPTFEESLRAAMRGQEPEVVDPGEPPGEEPPPPDSGPPISGDVAALLEQAMEHFEAADRALQRGDLATYQREIQAGREAVTRAQERFRQQEG